MPIRMLSIDIHIQRPGLCEFYELKGCAMSSLFTDCAVVVVILIALRADTQRRRLSWRRTSGWTLLTLLDAASLAFAIVLVAFLLQESSTFLIFSGAMIAFLFLWSEGKRQIQLQRPSGIVFAEFCLLFGLYSLLLSYRVHADRLGLVSLLLGLCVLGYVLPIYLSGREEHRILNQLAMQGEFIQQEWIPPTPECPFPERWRMFDAQSAEIEVLDFLKALIIAVKPDVIVETGTFIGHSTLSMADGLRQNGFGRIITAEFDPKVFEKAQQNIQSSGLSKWIEAHLTSSLDLQVNDQIDILYSDSDPSIREQEVRHFLPRLKTGGLVLIHDASSSFKVVREAALNMEREGLLSVLLLPTPRGLVVAQKLDGRT